MEGAKLCPCGKPARRKYCSAKCMRLHARRAWALKNKAKLHAYMKEYHKKWRDRNPEKVKGYAQKHRQKIGPEGARQRYLRSGEKRRQRAKAYYRENAERIKARAREYHHANKKQIRAKSAAYRKAHRKELAAKQLARYQQQKEYMVEWRKKNRAILKERQREYCRKNAADIAAKQKARTEALGPKGKLERSRRYTQKQKAKKLQMEFSLLTAAIANRPSQTSDKPPPPKAPRP